MSWRTRAQQILERFAACYFQQWRQTPEGEKWKNKWARKAPRKSRNGLSQNSPYAHGFNFPDYFWELIQALNKGDEEKAKGLILLHFLNYLE